MPGARITRCTRCNARVPADHADGAPAACIRCGQLVGARAVPPPPPPPPLPREPGFSVFQRIRHAPIVVGDAPYRTSAIAVRDDLVIHWPWARNRERHLIAVAVVPIAAAVIAAQLQGPFAAIGFLLALLATFYLCACMLFQQSRLTVTANVVELTHGPLPVPPGWRLRADQIDQLFVEEIVRHDDDGVAGSV
jgi:hypothetical protein